MRRLSGWDASLLYGETPNIHMHTLKIAIFDPSERGGMSVEEFRETLRGRLPLLPVLRYRLVEMPWEIHHPMWDEDVDVDLDVHVQPETLPAPGGRREFDELVSRVASTPLDRRLPLWQFTFVDGLAGGRLAVIGKVHHALADGVASGNLLARATDPLDASRMDTVAPSDIRDWPRGELIRASARDHLEQLRELPALIRDTRAGVRRWRAATASRPSGLAKPLDPPATFMNHVPDPRRRFATQSLVLGDVREAARSLGLTLNDVVLGVTAGVLRRAIVDHGDASPQPLIASVPVSLDTSPDRVSGNRLSSLFVSMPVDVDDPQGRCRVAHEATAAAKLAHARMGPELMGRWAEYLPPPLARHGFAVSARRSSRNRLMNLPVSNVRGPGERRRVSGMPITELYSVGPLTPGCAVNVTVWSYVDQLNVSLLADTKTDVELHELASWFRHELAVLRESLGLPAPRASAREVMAEVW